MYGMFVLSIVMLYIPWGQFMEKHWLVVVVLVVEEYLYGVI